MDWSGVRRGDIYYITARDTIGSEQGGNRPAVVVSNDMGNRHGPIVEVVYLTTRNKPNLPTHVPIRTTGRPSTAICEQIITVSKHRLERYVGHVTDGEMRHIEKALHVSLGISVKERDDQMKVAITAPFGSMEFDMQQDKFAQLMQKAFELAAAPGEEKKYDPVAAPTPAPVPELPQEVEVPCHHEHSEPEPPAPKRQMSRVERMFGNFRQEQEPMAVGADGKLEDDEPLEYKGFLIIKCEHCGKVHAFCAKKPISTYRCDCGREMELHDLLPVYIECKCGASFKYKTNTTEMAFTHDCLNCGSPVDLEINSRGTAYVTVRDRRRDGGR